MELNPKHRKEAVVDFQEKAKLAVVDYFNERVEKTDDFKLEIEEVYVVWFVKVLQNWKALLSTNIPDGMYYEITYNGNLEELYLDAYKKMENVCIQDDVLDKLREKLNG